MYILLLFVVYLFMVSLSVSLFLGVSVLFLLFLVFGLSLSTSAIATSRDDGLLVLFVFMHSVCSCIVCIVFVIGCIDVCCGCRSFGVCCSVEGLKCKFALV